MEPDQVEAPSPMPSLTSLPCIFWGRYEYSHGPLHLPMLPQVPLSSCASKQTSCIHVSMYLATEVPHRGILTWIHASHLIT